MVLTVDLDTLRLVKSATDLSFVPASEISFMRGDTPSVQVRFVRNSALVEIGAGAAIKFGIKGATDYDGDFLVYADSYSGPSASLYTFAPSFNTTALNTALSGDTASVGGLMQLEWIEGSNVTSTVPLLVTLSNDVIKGSEGAPTEADPDYYTAAESDAIFVPGNLTDTVTGVAYTITITNGVIVLVPTT
jgi:hypothetical protein